MAFGSDGMTALVLSAGQFCFGLGISMFSISTLSLRQAIVPAHLQGRVNATTHISLVQLCGVLYLRAFNVLDRTSIP